MNSYSDLYFYPGTSTFINTLGLRDAGELARAEAALSRASLRRLDRLTLTPDGFENAHRIIFEKIYPWAGKFRSVDMIKHVPSGDLVNFEKGAFVETSMGRLCGELSHDLTSKDGFKTSNKTQFSHRASVYLADLNFIHPFPEGNGRIQRLFLQTLAQKSGFKLDHQKLKPKAWIEASIDSYNQPVMGKHQRMSAVIQGAISGPYLSNSKETRENKLKALRNQIKDKAREEKDRGR